jgi:hypothetical protein
MAASRRSIKVGVLAEDASDVDVLRAVLPKIAPRKNFGIKPFHGQGCSKIHSKCRRWAVVLAKSGCSVLILLHDSDGNNVAMITKNIEAGLKPCPIPIHLIVIPIEEIEAWLLTDATAIKATFNLKTRPKCPANPERIREPKEYLRDLVWKASGKTKEYINTVHNKRIAERVALSSLRKCSAFLPLQAFWKQV